MRGKTVKWKGKKYIVMYSTENYMLVSHNGKNQLFSIRFDDKDLSYDK